MLQTVDYDYRDFIGRIFLRMLYRFTISTLSTVSRRWILLPFLFFYIGSWNFIIRNLIILTFSITIRKCSSIQEEYFWRFLLKSFSKFPSLHFVSTKGYILLMYIRVFFVLPLRIIRTVTERVTL